MVVFVKVKKEEIEKLRKLKGYLEEEPKTVYEEIRLKSEGVTLILYKSGKLLLQGRPEEVEKLAKQLEKKGVGEREKLPPFRQEKGWIIGSDESLKGDTFGGIVVAAVKANDKIREQLRELGVADSKTLSDKEILPMAQKIKRVAQCEIKTVLPEEYNRFKEGQTKLLNKLHQQLASYLFPGKHVVDKYPGCNIGDVAVEKAESKYVEVAAASVLARAAGLEQLNFLSAEAGFNLPKGSAHVQLALMEMKERELDFSRYVKLDFKNVQEILSG